MNRNFFKYKLCLHKAYFEQGYGLSHYLFKVIAVFGLTSQRLKETIIAIIIYTLGCYIGGWWWYNSKLREAELEVQNQFNPYIKEMRKLFGTPKKRNI